MSPNGLPFPPGYPNHARNPSPASATAIDAESIDMGDREPIGQDIDPPSEASYLAMIGLAPPGRPESSPVSASPTTTADTGSTSAPATAPVSGAASTSTPQSATTSSPQSDSASPPVQHHSEASTQDQAQNQPTHHSPPSSRNPDPTLHQANTKDKSKESK